MGFRSSKSVVAFSLVIAAAAAASVVGCAADTADTRGGDLNPQPLPPGLNPQPLPPMPVPDPGTPMPPERGADVTGSPQNNYPGSSGAGASSSGGFGGGSSTTTNPDAGPPPAGCPARPGYVCPTSLTKLPE
jgi:hypothetical protein